MLKNLAINKDVFQFRKVIEEQLAYYRLIKQSNYFGLMQDAKNSPKKKSRKLQELITFCEKVEGAVNCLAAREKELITLRYMDLECEYITDRDIYEGPMNLSRPSYMKYRNRAILKLASYLAPDCLNLRIEYKRVAEG